VVTAFLAFPDTPLISELHHRGKEVLLITSGAVALGKVRLVTSSLNGECHRNGAQIQKCTDPRAAAAAGQAGLMALYEQMFAQYGLSCAQVLISGGDLLQTTRRSLQDTLNELLQMNIIPILNGNDATAKTVMDADLQGVTQAQTYYSIHTVIQPIMTCIRQYVHLMY
jgi:delta-1-pyrroline-5-carboxylate synthetase